MDAVNHPSHYKRYADPLLVQVRGALVTDTDMCEMECFDAMVNRFKSLDQIRGYLIGNSFKYQWRYDDKGGVQDLHKAQWYENKLIKLEEIVEGLNARF
tara:strand:+ start:687 stop:983 length:297 start_codon:yes stop_codon:yes gene_type:complete